MRFTCYYRDMVRLINKKNLPIISNTVYGLMKLQEIFTHIENVDYPDIKQCIYVMWHANQFLVHGLPDRNKINILISNSLDGQIVAYVSEKWGFKVHRGSAGRKGAVSATKALYEALTRGENVAIMVDGPHGPYHEVKRGAIALSIDSNVPIVPVHWYSEEKTFKTFPSWDKMKSPVGDCKIINIYGKPIFPEGKNEDELAKCIKESLYELEQIAPEKYKKAKEAKLWAKK